jgi:hypothetical protein
MENYEENFFEIEDQIFSLKLSYILACRYEYNSLNSDIKKFLGKGYKLGEILDSIQEMKSKYEFMIRDVTKNNRSTLLRNKLNYFEMKN